MDPHHKSNQSSKAATSSSSGNPQSQSQSESPNTTTTTAPPDGTTTESKPSSLIQRIITTFSNYSSSSSSPPNNNTSNSNGNHNAQSTNQPDDQSPSDGHSPTSHSTSPSVNKVLILTSNNPHPSGDATAGSSSVMGHGKQNRSQHRHGNPNAPHPPLNHNPQLTHSVKSTKYSTPVLSISSLISLSPSSPTSMMPCDQFNSLKALIDMGNRSEDRASLNDNSTLVAQPPPSSSSAQLDKSKTVNPSVKPLIEQVAQASPPVPRTASTESTITSFASSQSNHSPPTPVKAPKASRRWSPTGQVIVTTGANVSTTSYSKDGHHRKPSRLNSKNNKFKRTKRTGHGNGHNGTSHNQVRHGSTGSGGSAGSVKSNYHSPSNKSPSNNSLSNKSAASLSSLSSYIISKSSLNLDVFSSNIRNGECNDFDMPIHYEPGFPGFEKGTKFFGPAVISACRNDCSLGILGLATSPDEAGQEYPLNYEKPIQYDINQLKQYLQVSQKIANRLNSMFSRKSKLQPKQKRFKPINNNNNNGTKKQGDQPAALTQEIAPLPAHKSHKSLMKEKTDSVLGDGTFQSEGSSATTTALDSGKSVLPVSKTLKNKVGRTYSRLSVDSQKSMYNQTTVRKSLACCRANSMSTVSILSRGGNNIMAKSLSQGDVVTPPEVLVRGYLFTRQIATGSYSVLYESNRPSNPTRKFACKHMRISEITNTGMLKDFVEEELKIIGQVNHENIIDLFEIINTRIDVFIFMKFAANGTILDYLYKFWRKPLPETYCKRWMMDLFKATAYIHGIMICHRDLKLENFLLDEKYNALLSDFGMAVSLKTPNASALLSVQCGTTDYLAPEVHMAANCSNSYYDPFPADMYAMGICLFEMANYFRPFAISISETNRTLIYRQKNRRYAFNNRIYLTEECHQVLHDLLEPKPQKRPQASRILEHDWFKTGNR